MKCQLNKLNNFFFPEMISHFPGNENKIYLTFDDGPTPEITNRVLAFLSEYSAKATFFCCGNNALKNFDLLNRIKSEGHLIGNHGYSHLHGWYTNTKNYVDDCAKAAEIIQTPIFRPPYGKLRRSQYQKLKANYTLFLWSALSWDFHPWVTPQKCLRISLKNLKSGAILVFHDTNKAADNLLFTLPRILEEGKRKGFQFTSLPFQYKK